MPQLLVRNVSDAVAEMLKKRAAEHGISAEEEHRRILKEALTPPLIEGEERTLFDHIRLLGEIAPDFEFEYERTNGKSRDIDF